MLNSPVLNQLNGGETEKFDLTFSIKHKPGFPDYENDDENVLSCPDHKRCWKNIKMSLLHSKICGKSHK